MRQARAFASLLALAALLGAGCGIEPGRAYRLPERLTGRAVPRNVTAAREGVAADDLLPSQPPAPLEWTSAVAEAPIERRLSNGVRVLVLSRHGFPSATVSLLVHGTSGTPSGLALSFAQTLASSSDVEQWQSFRDFTYDGATLRMRSWDDGLGLQFTALSPVILAAIAHFYEPFTHPDTTRGAIEETKRVMGRYPASSSSWKDANTALRSSMFPFGHPYRDPMGDHSTAAIEAIDKDALTALRERHLAARNVSVVAVGNVNPEWLVLSLERGLAGLPREPVKPAAPQPPPPIAGASCANRVRTLTRPGVTQSTFAIAYPTVPATHPDLVALEVLAALIWSRANAHLRGELGATPGVSAFPVALRHAGLFEITGVVQGERISEALAGITARVEALQSAAVSDLELDAAKSAVTRDSRFFDVGARLLDDALADVPFTLIASRTARVRALTAEDVRAAAARYLVTDRRCVVVVGPPQGP